MVGYYDLVSKVIVHFELMDQPLTSRLLMSGKFSQQFRVVCGLCQNSVWGGGWRIANLVMVISLRTANIVLVAYRLSHFDC